MIVRGQLFSDPRDRSAQANPRRVGRAAELLPDFRPRLVVQPHRQDLELILRELVQDGVNEVAPRDFLVRRRRLSRQASWAYSSSNMRSFTLDLRALDATENRTITWSSFCKSAGFPSSYRCFLRP